MSEAKLAAATNEALVVMKQAKADGASAEETLDRLAASPAIIPILVTILPLVLKIIREVRGGKTIVEALIDSADDIIEAILKFVEPENENGPTITQ